MKSALEFRRLIVFVLLMAEVAFCQTLQFKNFSEKDGIPGNMVSCFMQDSKGYLWIGTENGLSRYDGIEFKIYRKEDGLPDNGILSILEDREGRIWIGTNRGGLGCYHFGKFIKYSKKDGLIGKGVWAIAQDHQGHLWFATEEGLHLYGDGRFKIHTVAAGLGSNFITDLAVDGNGTLWVATKNGLSFRTPESPVKNFSTYTTKDGLVSDTILKVFPDSRGRIWIGTVNGLSCLQNQHFSSYTQQNGLPDNRICTIHEDSDGTILLGTLNGVVFYSKGTFVNYTTKNGLCNNAVKSILQDREGNTWIGTCGGLSILKPLGIMSFLKEDGLASSSVTSILQDKHGKFWFGTSDGLTYFSNDAFTTYTTKNGLSHNYILNLVEAQNGDIWIATVEGLSVLDAISKRFIIYTEADGLPSNIVLFSAMGNDGTIWLCTKKGLVRRVNKEFLPPPFDIPQLKINCIKEDKKANLWLATDFGLYKFSRQHLTHFTTAKGLAGNVCNGIFEDSRGDIWIPTDNGLSCLRENTGVFTNCTVADGLPANKCLFVREDHQGNLWIASVRGLSCFDGKTFEVYGTRKGVLGGNLCDDLFKDNSGRMWFANSDGLSVFTPPIRKNTVPPPIHITNVNIIEKDVPISQIGDLEHNQNYIKFDFIGLCYSAPESIVYKYRLDDIHRDWRETPDRYVSYPYLPPGKYTFKVKAVNNDGVESEAPVEVTFTIQPPYWKTWWFILLEIMTALSIFLLFFLWRIKRTKDKLNMEAKDRQLVMAQRMELMGTLAAGAVHDLKNLLAVISGYAKIVGKGYDPGHRNYKHVEKIKKTTSTAVQVVKQILAFAKQNHNKSNAVDIVELLSDIVEILVVTQPSEVRFIWQPPAETISLPIHPTRFQQLVMNLCINAVHAMPDGGELRIALSTEAPPRNREGVKSPSPGPVLLEISDTGSGMEKDVLDKIFDPLYTTKDREKGTGLGLFVVKQVVREYDGNIEVKSQPGKGTTFCIRF